MIDVSGYMHGVFTYLCLTSSRSTSTEKLSKDSDSVSFWHLIWLFQKERGTTPWITWVWFISPLHTAQKTFLYVICVTVEETSQPPIVSAGKKINFIWRLGNGNGNSIQSLLTTGVIARSKNNTVWVLNDYNGMAVWTVWSNEFYPPHK